MASTVINIPNIVTLENYNSSDLSLLSSKNFVRSFGAPGDYIEFHVYSPDGTILSSNYNFKGYSIPGTLNSTSSLTSNVTFTPDQDIQNLGYVNGTFDVQYNILRNRINTSATGSFFISQISSDRTELRLTSNTISNSDLENGTISFISDINSSPYFKDFLLDFGGNNFSVAVNISLDKNTTPYTVLIKLYEPLDAKYDINTSLWIVEELSVPYSFNVELTPDPVVEITPMLRGPNFDLERDHKQIPPSQYTNYLNLLGNNTLSSYQQLINMMNQQGIQLNIDYSDYNNFVHYSSAKQRLLNFYQKIQNIEGFNMQIGNLRMLTSSFAVSNSIYLLQNNINTLIQNFDGYDNYLYTISSSLSWPKSGSGLPYSLYPSTSSQVTNWLGSDDSFNLLYGGQILSASLYDQENPDYLVHSIPEFVVVDSNNDSYTLFVEMVGQLYDVIWTYIKAAGDIYKANNSFEYGISKDLVYYALNSLGVKLYNDNSNQDLFSYYLGQTQSGSYLPATNSFQTLISAYSQSISGQDQVKEIFKRVYHNVPYILKTKGTANSLRALSNLYGVPSTIMRFHEYGGMDKTYCTDSPYSYDRFSYALNTEGSGSVVVPWAPLNINNYNGIAQTSFADSIEFRFKLNSFSYTEKTQSLLYVGDGTDPAIFGLNLQYISGGYGNINFFLNSTASGVNSSPIKLPFFSTASDGDYYWWNVMIRRRNQSFALENDLIDFDIAFVINNDSSLINVEEFGASGSMPPGDQYYDIFVKNEIAGAIGHQGSSSIFVSQSYSSSYNDAWNDAANLYLGGYGNSIFLGELQELRLWAIPLYQSAFNKHTLNPESVEGNDSGSFYNYLAARFPLGNDLYIYNHYLTSSVISVHPNQIATFPTASFVGFTNKVNYLPNYEEYYSNVPVVGYSSPVTRKVRLQDVTISGSVISPFIRLEEPLAFPLTKDLHFINGSFSPQDEINDNIIASLGSTFIIDDYIGDPGTDNMDHYPDLSNLKKLYYQQYFSKYDYKDYINLIQYFNNSLFKMFQDFVAGRANLQTGITIKPTILERSKVKRYEPDVLQINNFTASIKAGSFQSSNNLITGYGNGLDQYNGELSGSVVNAFDYFLQSTKNPYKLYPKTPISNFTTSDFNVLVNNIEQNVTSSRHKRIDWNGKLLVPTEIPDSNYTIKSQINGRYDGSKSTSLTYTFYTSQSFSSSTQIWPGDSSYGKNASIDSNTLKFGWVKDINSQSLNFYDKTSVILKYLVDGDGSTIQLSRHNYNLVEVQNTFKSFTPTVVSLANPISPSNQTILDGDQQIFEGGFSYWPIIYREASEELHFDYLSSLVTSESVSLTTVQNQIFQYNTKKANDPTNQIDQDTSEGGYTLTYGNSTLTEGTFALPGIIPFTNWIYSSIPDLSEATSVVIQNGFNGGFPSTIAIQSQTNQTVYQINPQYLNFNDFVSTNDTFTEYVQLSDQSYAIKIPRTSTYNFDVDIPFNISVNDTHDIVLKTVAVLERSSGSNGEGPWQYLASSQFSYVEQPFSNLSEYGWTSNRSLVQLKNFLVLQNSYNGGVNDFPLKVLCSINQNVVLNAGDYVRISFFIVVLDSFLQGTTQQAKISFRNRFNANVSQSIGSGRMIMTDTINDATIVTTNGFYNQNSLFSIAGIQNNIMTFTDAASLLYGKIIFNQAQISSSTAQLYSPIDYPFLFQVGDVVRLTSYYTTNATYYRVNQVIPPVTGSDGVTVFSDLQLVLDKPVNIIGNVSSNFVIFRRLPDETSVILNFQKNPGETSQALLIPYDLDTSVKNNVANIASQISQDIAGLS